MSFCRRHLIESLVPGSGAERCGEIFAGDELLTVDGVDVNGRQVADLAPIFMGPQGSTAILTLMRKLEPTNTSLEAVDLIDVSDEVLALPISPVKSHTISSSRSPRPGARIMGGVLPPKHTAGT